MGPSMQRRTFRYRVKDKHAAELERMARAVNVVWNWANETQRTAVQRGDLWPSYFTLTMLTKGASADLPLTSNMMLAVCRRYVSSQRAAHKRWLRFRSKRSLGWVPLRAEDIRPGLRIRGTAYSVWLDREIPAGSVLTDGSSFSQDSRGRWYLNVAVSLSAEARPAPSLTAVGLDLGLKDLVTLSNGESVAAPRLARSGETAYASAQRARKPRLVKAVHARIANRRRDFLHKTSTAIVRRFHIIRVGNVSSKALIKTRFAKSVHDASWTSFRGMLSYKAIARGVSYAEVDERGSTQTCSECGFVGGPKGREGLVIREWACAGCGLVHDRDVNAARNILRWGCPPPTGAGTARSGDIITTGTK